MRLTLVAATDEWQIVHDDVEPPSEVRIRSFEPTEGGAEISVGYLFELAGADSGGYTYGLVSISVQPTERLWDQWLSQAPVYRVIRAPQEGQRK